MAAMTSGFAALTSDLAALTSDFAALPTDFGAQTILGCPVSSFIAIESACSIAEVPSCAESSSLDANCCGSLSAYESSAYNCYTGHSLACLNTADLQSYFSSYHITISSEVDPCSQYGAMNAPKTSTAATGSTSNENGATATSETQKATTTGSMTTSGTTTGSATESTSATGTQSAGNSIEARGNAFKIYFGLTIGALFAFSL